MVGLGLLNGANCGFVLDINTLNITAVPLVAGEVANEVYEETLLKDQTTRESKSRAKTDGRDVLLDD